MTIPLIFDNTVTGAATVIGGASVSLGNAGRVIDVTAYSPPTVTYQGDEGTDLAHAGATLLGLIDELHTAGIIVKSGP